MPHAIDAAIAKLKQRTRAAPAMQMDIWPERVRALPNPLARCALFTAAGKKEDRVAFKRTLLASLSDREIHYTGEELRQDDQDVWLQVVHLARVHPAGDRVELTAHAVLMALGWGRSADNYKRLRASILRMTEATVWVTSPGQTDGWSGRLVDKVHWRDEDNAGSTTWQIQLDRRIIELFAPNGVSHIEWEQRLTLKPLAKWLHSFYSTHREPHPYRVATLHQLCGSKSARIAHFRNSLMHSFEELVAVGFLEAFQHDARTDTIAVTRRARMLALTAA